MALGTWLHPQTVWFFFISSFSVILISVIKKLPSYWWLRPDRTTNWSAFVITISFIYIIYIYIYGTFFLHNTWISTHNITSKYRIRTTTGLSPPQLQRDREMQYHLWAVVFVSCFHRSARSDRCKSNENILDCFCSDSIIIPKHLFITTQSTNSCVIVNWIKLLPIYAYI